MSGLVHDSGTPYFSDDGDREEPKRPWDCDSDDERKEVFEESIGRAVGLAGLRPRGALARLYYDERGSDSGGASASLRKRIHDEATFVQATEIDMSAMEAEPEAADAVTVTDDSDLGAAEAVTPEAKRPRESNNEMLTLVKNATDTDDDLDSATDLETLMLVNFKISHDQMSHVTASLNTLGQTVNDHSKELVKLKNLIDEKEKHQKNHEKTLGRDVKNIIAEEMQRSLLGSRCWNRGRARQEHREAVPPPSSSATASPGSPGHIGPAGCELIIGPFGRNMLGDNLVVSVTPMLQGTSLPGLERRRRPRVLHLRFSSTGSMFQSPRLLKNVRLQIEGRTELWAGVDKIWEERERGRPIRECVNTLREALQTIKGAKSDANFTGYDIEAVYKAGHEAVRATTSGWTGDLAVAFMQGGVCKWGSDGLLLQAFDRRSCRSFEHENHDIPGRTSFGWEGAPAHELGQHKAGCHVYASAHGTRTGR